MLKSWTDTPQKRFRKAKTFQIHYGWIGEQELLALSGYDLLILEPRQITKEQVEFLQAKMASGARGSVAKRGSDLFERLNGMRDDNGASGLKAAVVFGYLSIMETPTWNQERLTQMESTFYYRDASGDRVHFPQWDAYLMDIRHQGYQELLFQEIRTQIVARGMDGVFLDTVADIDEVVADPLSREEMRLAYTTFLKKVRGEFPFLLLIQNRAFETLDHSAPHLDGVLWEDWRGDLLADPWVQVQLGRLRAHKKPAGLRVFAVSAGLEPIHRETAQAQGFVHLSRPDGYDRL